MASAGGEIIDYSTTESSAQCEVKEVEYREDDDEKSRSCVDCIVNPLKNIFPGKKTKLKNGATQGVPSISSQIQSLSNVNQQIQTRRHGTSYGDNLNNTGTSPDEPLPNSEIYRISTEEIQLHSRRSSGSVSSSSSSYYEVDSTSLDNDEISIAHGIHTQKGIQFSYSIFIFKRLKKAVTVFSIFFLVFIMSYILVNQRGLDLKTMTHL